MKDSTAYCIACGHEWAFDGRRCFLPKRCPKCQAEGDYIVGTSPVYQNKKKESDA